MKKYISLVFLFAFAFLLFLPQPIIAQEQNAPVCASEVSSDDVELAESLPLPITFICYGVVIDLQLDGSFHVQEVQQVYFAEGGLTTGFSELPLALTTGIDNVTVAEIGQPYQVVDVYEREANTFYWEQSGEQIFVDWAYEEVPAGEVRTFLVEYDVHGALWTYETGDFLEYRAVTDARDGIFVLNSRVVVNFPEAWNPETIQADVFGTADFADPVISETGVEFELTNTLPTGVPFQVFVSFPHGLVDTQVQPWQAEEDSAELDFRFLEQETVLTIHAEGYISVEESQSVAVAEGAMYSGFQAWTLLALDSIENLAIWEGEQAFQLDEVACNYCFDFSATESSDSWVYASGADGELRIEQDGVGRINSNWYFPPLVRGESTTFRLTYDARGAIQVTEDGQAIGWLAVAGYDVPIEQASVIIDFPSGVSLENAGVEGGTLQRMQDGRVRVVHNGPVEAGEIWRVRIAMPPDATEATVPNWQQDMAMALEDGERIQEEIRLAEIALARRQLGFGVAGVLVFVVGMLGVFVVWYLRGRDEFTEPIPSYLNEPPSSLAPGLVAYLIDEEANAKGVLASLFHLAELGLIKLELKEPLRLQRQWPELLAKGQVIELDSGREVTLPNHLIKLFNGISYHVATDKPTTLTSLASKWHSILPSVYKEIGQEADAFFDTLPDKARNRWMSFGQILLILSILGAFIFGLLYVPLTGDIALAPPLALMPVSIAMMVVSRWMARRTGYGAEEWAKWEAFSEYLENLRAYANDDNKRAQTILDNYFAYAVALGVEEVVLQQAEELGGNMPRWTRPVVLTPSDDTAQFDPSRPALPRRLIFSQPTPIDRNVEAITSRPTAPAGSEAPTESANLPPEKPITSLTGLSDSLGKRIDKVSRGLTDVLNTAVGNKANTPFRTIGKGVKATGQTIGSVLSNAAASSSSGRSGGYSGKSSSSRRSRSSFGSSRSRSSSRRSSGRRSSSRRSSGGGRRGFGR